MPYVWERFNIDPETQAAINRALLILAENGSSSRNDFVEHPFEEAAEAVPIIPKEDEVAVDGDTNSRHQAMNGVRVEGSPASRGLTERSTSHLPDQNSVLRKCRDREERERLLGSVRLKDVKELVPSADYCQIRLVLARCKLEGSSCLA